jgi:hypothetical protein
MRRNQSESFQKAGTERSYIREGYTAIVEKSNVIGFAAASSKLFSLCETDFALVVCEHEAFDDAL